MLEYHIKRADIQAEPADYVLSDGEPDRMGDTIDPAGWQLSEFAPTALFNHEKNAVIGKWENVRVEAKRLVGRLVLAQQGTSPVVDMVRALISQDMLDGVSVGFRALKKEPRDPKDELASMFGPFRFLKIELLEASLVSVAANPRARRIAKQFLSDDEAASVFARRSSSSSGVFAKPKPVPRKEPGMSNTMPFGKRIEIAEQKLVTLKDQLSEIAGKLADEDPTDEQSLEVETLKGEIETTQKAIGTLKTIEQGLAVKAQEKLPAPPRIKDSLKKLEPRDHIYRAMTCQVISRAMHEQGKAVYPEQIRAERYPGDELTDMVLKTAMQPATTTVAGWAQELVGQTIADFLGALMPVAIYPQLAALGPRYTFGQNGIIKIPARAATPTVNGSFVGEGQPIPVRKLGLTSISLTPKKLAVISEFTRELAMSSTPSIESVIRQAVNEDTAQAIDTVLIDATAADTVRPAGLRNGVSGLTPSVLTAAFDKMVADIKALIAAITANRGGRNLVLMVNPAQELSLEWTVVNGIFPFDSVQNGELRGLNVISSATIPATMLIMVDAADFASVTADSAEFNVTDVATIHEEDTLPLPIVGGTVTPPASLASVAAPVRSLWQTYSIGIRMTLPMNWAMRRTGMVAWMTAVTW